MNNKKNTGMRINVTPEAEKLLVAGRSYLTDKACKMTPSQFASKVIEIFFAKYFNNEKKSLEKIFFDKKSYIKNILENSCDDDEELSDSLRQLLVKMKPKRKRRTSNKNASEVKKDD